ncbi:MAG: response regulator transcription factor [Oscillospiraceae bacterium]|nr:response regulator transcription factor [Oscillospiraceae bacterium]
MYNILIVEDDTGIASALRQQLSSWGMRVKTVSDFRNVLGEFSEFSPHLVLMDISLPFMNGYHWCGEIRRVSRVPIIFISSASENMNIVMAMNMGGDDFVSKPFSMDVLTAKISALLRRTYDYGESAPVYEHRGAMLSTADGSLVYEGQTISLSKNESRILLTLMQNKGKTVSREKLMEALWQTDEFVDENTLTVNVGRLRRKLDAAGLEGFIGTKFGVGYIIS